MEIATLTFSSVGGWSTQPLPDLDSERTLVVVFGAARFGADAQPLRELRTAYPRAHLIGCSTSGEIHGGELSDDTLTVAVARFESTDVASAVASVSSALDSFAAGSALAAELTRDDLKAILLLSDGLQVNGSELLRGLNSTLAETVVVTGGLAGDGERFESTWVLTDDGPTSGRVTAVGLYGDHVRVGHGSHGGWSIFGPARRVTRSEQNVLYELDGKPALQIYKEYLGDLAQGLPATALRFPLALRACDGDEKMLVRTVLAVDEAQQSMTFAGDVPEGHTAQLMRANPEALIEGACAAAQHTRGDAPTSDMLAIAISCVGRRLVLGERTEEEIEGVLSELPAGVHQIGFYSYGEIAPYATGHPDLHNQTMTLTTISEV